MADLVFNVVKGKAAEKVADSASNLGVLLLKSGVESDALMRDRTSLSDLLGANSEADFTNYARKTGLTGTVVVDQTNNWVNIQIANQTWIAAGGGVNNTLAKLVVYYEETASDAGRIPVVALDFVTTTTGLDLIVNFQTEGFFRAA